MDQSKPPDTIEAERLVLRRYRYQDAAALLRIVDDNREQLLREFAPMAALQSMPDTQVFISEKDEQWNVAKTFCYGIWRKNSDQLIGQIQVKNIAWEIPAAEFGYFIGRSRQRQGHASESIRTLLQTLFEEMPFQRIFLRILPSNNASLLLAEKLGFQQEGLHRNAFRCGMGELHDVHYLALLRQDFRPQ